jgi:hypothetical protein
MLFIYQIVQLRLVVFNSITNMDKENNNMDQGQAQEAQQAQFDAQEAEYEAQLAAQEAEYEAQLAAQQAQEVQEQVPVVLGEKVPASNMFQEGKFQGWSISERINGCLFALECFERGPNVGVYDYEVENDLTDLFERVENRTLTAADWQRLENALLEDDLQFLQNLQ